MRARRWFTIQWPDDGGLLIKMTTKNLTTALILLAVMLLFGSTAIVRGQTTTFTPVCVGDATLDTAKFVAIKSTVGATNAATITLPYKLDPTKRCKVNSLSLTANITLDNSVGSGIFVVTGQVLTVAGPRVNPLSKTMFFNVAAAQGIIVLTGRGNNDRLSTDPCTQGDLFYATDINQETRCTATNAVAQMLDAATTLSPANITPGVFNLLSYGAVCNGSTADDTALALALAAIGSNQATLLLPYTATGKCLLALNATIPANVTIDYGQGTGWLGTTGKTLTIVGDEINKGTRTAYFNFGAGLATLSYSGGPTLGEQLLSTTAAVNMNTATATTLYTCPTGRTCVITKVVVSSASTSLTTASWCYGWESATFTNVINTATHTELASSSLYTILIPKAGSTVGAAGGTFKTLNTILQGGAATATMSVYGYLSQ